MKEDLHFWDLKLLENGVPTESTEPGEDIHGRKNDDQVAGEDFTAGAEDLPGRFMYKICQSQWDYPHDYFDAPMEDEIGTEAFSWYMLTPEQKE
jgi:hypothetical protein